MFCKGQTRFFVAVRTGSVFVDVYYVVTNNSARLQSARVIKVETIEFSKDEASKKKEKGHWQDDAVEGLNVINGPKCNKVLNVITFCPKCNKLLSCQLQ